MERKGTQVSYDDGNRLELRNNEGKHEEVERESKFSLPFY